VASFSANTVNGPYGPLQQGLVFELQDGYSVLTGRNNSGKSALLQLLMVRAYHDASVGPDGVVYIPPHRGYVASSTETGGRSFRNYNDDLMGQITGQPLQYAGVSTPSVADLPKLLLNHDNFRRQTSDLDRFLVGLGFSELVLRDAQQAHFDDIAVVLQGSGLRSLFTILCALTDQRLQMILIDEPENSLEPRLQKSLRDLLVARGAAVKIAVATHSHLFLNRGAADLGLNHVVTREQGQTAIRRLSDPQELWAITFDQLGSNTEDLFFPGNYLVVEGASDQVIVEKVLSLLGAAVTKLKVVAATGVANVANRLAAIENSLIPLVMKDSPYSGKVVVLLDQPSKGEEARVQELRGLIGARLVELPTPSLEEYLPDQLYARAGRDKSHDLVELTAYRTNGRLKDLRQLKREISQQLSAVLQKGDFGEIKLLVDAVEDAVARA
jgi:hypothetical protein